MKRLLSLIVGLAVTVGVANAQSEKYGLDSAKTIENASIYTELMKQKNPKGALPYWRYVFNNAPALQVNTYVWGEQIMIHMLQTTKNRAYFDSLMMVYDQRLKYFPKFRNYDEAYIMGKKGASMLRFSRNDEDKKAAMDVLTMSFEKKGDKSDIPVVQNLFRSASELLSSNTVTRDEYLNLYVKCSDFAEKGIASAGTGADKYKELKGKLDGMFFDAGVADCNTLNEMLSKRYEANKGDMAVLKQIASLLRRSECLDIPLYAQVAEDMYSAEPTADAAYSLALLFGRRKEYDKMEKYLLEAVSKCDSDETKAEYFMTLAKIMRAKGNGPEAKKYAIEVLKRQPNNGEAHLLIGKVYADYAKNYGDDDFDHRSVYWVAVDRFNRAKSVDSSVTEEANKLISVYSANFPSKDEGFFRGIMAGSDISIKSWIGETTKARFN